MDARTRYPNSVHLRLWSDCASVIRLHLAHIYFAKYCFAAAQSASHQVSLGTQAPHILSLAVIRVGVDVARQAKLSYIALTLQKHALHQFCRSEYFDNNLFFHIFVSSCPLFVLTVRQCRRHNANTIRVNCIAQ